MGRRSTLIVFLIMVFSLLSVQSAEALRFPIQGARGQAMGGAGVAEIDDENALNWNPANGSIRPRSFDFGIHASAEFQSTKDIQKELQDLQDFEEEVQDLDSITGSGKTYADTNAYLGFIRLTSELKNVNRDGQGLLGNITGGLNTRQGGLGFIGEGSLGLIVNNRTSFSVSNDLDLDAALIGATANDNDSGTTRQFITGSASDKTVSGGKSTGRISSKTVDVIEQSIKNGLNQQGLTTGQLGFSGSPSPGDLANEIAHRIQEADPNGDTITESQIRNASKTLIPSVIAAADTDATEFDTQDQKVVAQGISLTEVGLSYTHGSPIVSFLGGDLHGGANLKLMQGRVGYKEFPVFESNDEEDAFDENTETSNDFGVDVGLLYDQMGNYGFRIGLVGKNLNTPSFDYPDAADTAGLETFEIKPQFRMGLSAYPLRIIPGDALGTNWWKLSADYDLTSNETSLPDYESRYLAVGNEFNLYNRPWLNLALRAGLRDNLEQSAEGTIYTGGLGIKIAYVNIDISGTLSDKTVKDEDGDKRPTVLGGAFNLAFRF